MQSFRLDIARIELHTEKSKFQEAFMKVTAKIHEIEELGKSGWQVDVALAILNGLLTTARRSYEHWMRVREQAVKRREWSCNESKEHLRILRSIWAGQKVEDSQMSLMRCGSSELGGS